MKYIFNWQQSASTYPRMDSSEWSNGVGILPQSGANKESKNVAARR
ncbi:hypothetical protein [Undibacterium sp. Ji22W]